MPNFWNVLNDVLRRSDVVLQVLDARLPEMTRNREIESKIGDKPMVFVLNKCDLISKEEGDRIKKEFGSRAVFVSCKKYYGIKLLKTKIGQISHQIQGRVTIGVVGYPNTGKSSLINALTSRGSAKTSSHSGFTRGKQMIRLKENVYLIDTPGVIPYKEDDEIKHSIIASVNPQDIKDPDIAAMKIIRMMMERDKPALESLYQVDITSDDEYDILHEIGNAANLLKKGGEVDERRTGIRIIQDWQRGKLKKDTIVSSDTGTQQEPPRSERR